MARISARVSAASLGFDTGIEVIIPHNSLEPKPVGKVLYLLHGLSQDSTSWGRKSTIEIFAEQFNYAVIMPEVHRSFYHNMAYGSDYFTYVAFELPQICEQLFQIKHVREKTFVAGLSMGGYGAIRCGLTRPDFYGGCAGFSGALDPHALLPNMNAMGMIRQITGVLGTDLIIPDDANLFRLSEKVAQLQNMPRVLVTCGDSDELLAINRGFDAHMKKLSIPYKYMEWGGGHDWKFWEECLPVAFEFFGEEV